jgi:hypothetical protein
VKLNKIKYIPLYITKLKNTQEGGHSICGQWITAQFLYKPVGNRNTERPTERLCDQTPQIHTAGSKQMKVSCVQLHNKEVTTGNRTYRMRRHHHQISPGTKTVVE